MALQQPAGMDADRADEFGRRVSVALVHGNWEQAHLVVEAAKAEHATSVKGHAPSYVLGLYLNETTLPFRLVGILERHGMFTVNDVLLAGLDCLAEFKSIGRASVEVIVTSLLEAGVTREQLEARR